MPSNELKGALAMLGSTLRDIGEGAFSGTIDECLKGSDAEIEALLKSNDLWGGSGSVADKAGIGYSTREKRREVEQSLISLGERQIQEGITNPQTQMWVSVFKKWK